MRVAQTAWLEHRTGNGQIFSGMLKKESPGEFTRCRARACFPSAYHAKTARKILKADPKGSGHDRAGA
jgi:hypothetical protein